eukprot:m.281556 g.281556  ORF g.281556 m.281556 type:complete len:63 (-) comp15752_c1_seq2:1482-1670(-)
MLYVRGVLATFCCFMYSLLQCVSSFAHNRHSTTSTNVQRLAATYSLDIIDTIANVQNRRHKG